MKPYYEDKNVILYHGDCSDVISSLGRYDLLLTDPPYGINQGSGMGGGGYVKTAAGKRKRRTPRRYSGGHWDKSPPDKDLLARILSLANTAIVWGGNYMSQSLPPSQKWLVWDKEQTMPTYSDCEIAWTNLPGNSTKMFRYAGSGLLAKEQTRWHPTQKPVALMLWCIQLSGTPKTIIDPFAGSGSTGVAAKQLGLRCTLIEQDEQYCEAAANRLRQEYLSFE